MEMGYTFTGIVVTDHTGAFPVVSSQVNRYVFIIYDYYRKAILEDPMKPRKGGEILRAHKKCSYIYRREDSNLSYNGCKMNAHIC